MDGHLLPGWGLRSVEASDAATLNAYFATLAEPLSDYTFSQIFTWRNSLRVLWRELDGHLCVFANGSGDLTLLMPPIGDGDTIRALRSAFELMDDYNARHGVPADRSRVEYASEELLARLDPGRSRLSVAPMGHDYVYSTGRMIDLVGGDLASKRQAKNRFMRNHVHRVERYDAAPHLDACLALLHAWNDHQSEQQAGDAGDAGDTGDPTTASIKRQKELLATELALRHAGPLGLVGMVVHVTDDAAGERLAGFTLGEHLGRDQGSVVIEKTDLRCKGLAQFIFSEFCRLHWSHRPLVNVGDDWGLESLAWTKQSYRPIKLLKKFVLRQDRAATSATGFDQSPSNAMGGATRQETPVVVRGARDQDLEVAARIERESFDAYQLDLRRLRHLRGSKRATVRVAEREGSVVGHAVSVVCRFRDMTWGRIYSVAVDPRCRGQGIGRALLDDALGRLASRDVTRVVLEVERSNRAAVTLYENSGFRPVAVLGDFYGAGRDGIRMAREHATTGKMRPAA